MVTNNIMSGFINKVKTCTVAKIAAPVGNTGRSNYSFNIVCSKDNGKRTALSKSLANRLGVDTSFDIIAQPDIGEIHIGKDLKSVNDNYSTYKLCGAEKKYCYNAELVLFLISAYKLDFGTHVSRSYSNITFDMYNGTTVATIILNEDAHKAYLKKLDEDTADTAMPDNAETENAEPETEEENFVFDDEDETIEAFDDEDVQGDEV